MQKPSHKRILLVQCWYLLEKHIYSSYLFYIVLIIPTIWTFRKGILDHEENYDELLK